MASHNREIEIKVKVEKSEPLLVFLQSQATLKGEASQRDEYYSPEQNGFLSVRPVKQWLRLRETDRGASLNYKDWQFDDQGKSQFCTEYETKIEQAEPLRLMLKALHYRPIVVVDKVRKTYTYKDYEIAIDRVKDLGEFVEIEYCGQDANIDPKVVTDDMVQFLKEVGCGRLMRDYVGYPFLLLFPNESQQEVL